MTRPGDASWTANRRLEPPAQLVARRARAAELEATGKFLRPHAMQWSIKGGVWAT